MNFFQSRMMTPALRRTETRLRALLSQELEQVRGQDITGDAPNTNIRKMVEFTAAFHSRYEAWQQEALRQHQNPVRCGPGCGNCCRHYPLSIEFPEAVRLYMVLRNRDDFGRILEECYRRVQTYARLRDESPVRDGAEEEWEDELLHRYFALELRCPMLDELGNCSCHDARPVTCRMYFSFTDPKYCSAEHLQTPANQSFHICLPDVVEEDFAELSELWGKGEWSESLYEVLLQLNAKEGEGWFA